MISDRMSRLNENFKFVRIYSINFSFYFFSVSVLFVFVPAARKQLVHLEMFSLNFLVCRL